MPVESSSEDVKASETQSLPEPTHNDSKESTTAKSDMLHDRFLSFIPNAEIIQQVFHDVDEDGKLDMVALFSLESKDGTRTNSNIGIVFDMEGPISAVELASGMGWFFVDTFNFFVEGNSATVLLVNPTDLSTKMQQVSFTRILSAESIEGINFKIVDKETVD